MVAKKVISVIIPTKNRAKLLPKAIDSVFNQTHKNIELIIVNDASTDATEDVINNYQSIDSRIIYKKNNESLKAQGAKSAVSDVASGDYIAVLDDDDIWLPGKLEKQLQYVEKYSVVSCLAIIKTKKGQNPQSPDWSGHKEFSFRDMFINGSYFFPSGMLVRKTILDDVNWFDPGLPGMDVFFKIAYKFGPGIVINEPLVVFNRAHDYSLYSHGNFPEKDFKLHKKWESYVEKKIAVTRYGNLCFRGVKLSGDFRKRLCYMLKSVYYGDKRFKKIKSYINMELNRLRG